MHISSIKLPFINEKNTQLDMLRLDLIHPQISGNKWYKLKYNIQEAQAKGCKTLLSFGGAYSNHLHALAYSGKQFSFHTIGIVRGEKVTNPTLQDCENWGMQLHFISREEYRNKTDEDFIRELSAKYPDAYIIPEGGANDLGVKGCRDILKSVEILNYDAICCAIGTGTTVRGLLQSLPEHVNLYGFAAIKGAAYLQQEIEKDILHKSFSLMADYHFGGFAKRNQALLSFMKNFEEENNITLDVVYTAKMMYGISDIIKNQELFNGKKLLIIHSGGVQGNRSIIAF